MILAPANREGHRFVIPLAAVWLLLVWWQTAWALAASAVVLAAIAFTLFFFRDPSRTPPADASLVVAPADGTVVQVDEVEETWFGTGRRRRVAIFLSVFDVHVNRMPVAGRIVQGLYQTGKFLDVRHPEASALNEFQAWRIETGRGPVVVRAIAGLVARRIVNWVREGDSLERGERFGMIRFGSRTEIFLPLECEILVKPRDKVQGAATPIARWN